MLYPFLIRKLKSPLVLLGAYPNIKLFIISGEEILFFKNRFALLEGEFFRQSANYNAAISLTSKIELYDFDLFICELFPK